MTTDQVNLELWIVLALIVAFKICMDTESRKTLNREQQDKMADNVRAAVLEEQARHRATLCGASYVTVQDVMINGKTHSASVAHVCLQQRHDGQHRCCDEVWS